jgi:phosphotriesterase-related protein
MIETVLGPIPASALGTTSTNEHVLTDSRRLLRPTREGGELTGRMRPEILGDLRWSWMSLADNLTLDDPDTAVEELAAAADEGIRTIVEATSWGMGPDHAALPDIARRSGVQIVSAYGSYIDKTLPDAWRAQTEAEMEAAFTRALTVAVPGTSYRAGLLGLLGTSGVEIESEHRALRAAARAASAVGAAVSIRLDGAARRGPEIAEILTAHGLPASKILFCNMDKVLDAAYVAEVAATGAVVEFAFGSEHNFADGARDATDAERLAFVTEFLAQNPHASVTLSCSVWTKGQLTRHGGMGYAHIVRRILPALRRAGVAQDRLDEMLVGTPARLLDRD